MGLGEGRKRENNVSFNILLCPQLSKPEGDFCMSRGYRNEGKDVYFYSHRVEYSGDALVISQAAFLWGNSIYSI